MTALIVQARLDSTRLPGKAILPLDGAPVVQRVLEVLKTVPAALHILACPEDSAETFAPIAECCGFLLFAGPKEDVLGRYAQAIRHFSLDKAEHSRVIRATADNPFVFADAAARINEEAAVLNADYAAYAGLPYGAGVESVSCAALLQAEREAAAPDEREHVCPYLYHNPCFRLHRPLAPPCWQHPELRLTIDTRADYAQAAQLYSALPADIRRYTGQVIIAAASLPPPCYRA